MVTFRYYLIGGDTAAPSGLYARLCHVFLVSSFYYEQRYLRFTGPILMIFLSANGRYLREFSRSVPFFSDSSRDVAMATNFVAKLPTPGIYRSGSLKRNGISLPQCMY